MKKLIAHWPNVVAIFASIVFLDSLRYKFTDHEYTQVIFGRLNDWAGTLGVPGIFGHTGIFSQYVIGSAELLAAILLLTGISIRFRFLQFYGALVAVAVMSGAIFFHLFTPLGIDPNNDGGGLFIVACLIWIGSVTLAYRRFNECPMLCKLKGRM